MLLFCIKLFNVEKKKEVDLKSIICYAHLKQMRFHIENSTNWNKKWVFGIVSKSLIITYYITSMANRIVDSKPEQSMVIWGLSPRRLMIDFVTSVSLESGFTFNVKSAPNSFATAKRWSTRSETLAVHENWLIIIVNNLTIIITKLSQIY